MKRNPIVMTVIGVSPIDGLREVNGAGQRIFKLICRKRFIDRANCVRSRVSCRIKSKRRRRRRRHEKIFNYYSRFNFIMKMHSSCGRLIV